MRIFPAAFLFFAFAGGARALETEKIFRAASGGRAKAEEVVRGRILVKFSGGLSQKDKKKMIESRDASILNELDFIGVSVIKLPPQMSVSKGLEKFGRLDGIETAEPDHVYRVKRVPSDDFLAAQYALSNVDAYGAWEYETGFSSGVTVAVMDTGIDSQHPELSGKIAAKGNKFFDPNSGGAESTDDPPSTACVHGTRVAGIAAAQTDNSAGIAGMSWGAQILSLRIFDGVDCNEDCSDALPKVCATSDSAIINAMNYAATLSGTTTYGKIILNMSLGDESNCSDNISLTAAAVSAFNNGVVLVAASGNYSPDVNSPANCSKVIPVGSTDSSDNLAGFSTTGPKMTLRGVTAPGESLYTTTYSGSEHGLYAYDSGTSFSAPMVSGLAALVYSARPALSSQEVGDIIRETADDLGSLGPDESFGYGRVNAYKALRYAVTGSLPDFGEKKIIAFPNPFRPSEHRLIQFVYSSGVTAEEGIKIYTMEGELVKKVRGLVWDGKNEAGAPAASGVYVFLLKAEQGNYRGRFALIR